MNSQDNSNHTDLDSEIPDKSKNRIIDPLSSGFQNKGPLNINLIDVYILTRKMISGVELVELILKHAGPVPQKKLQKLAYLFEIEYIMKHGRRLSDLTFKRYYYGPYSDGIKNIENLGNSKANIIKPEIEQELISYIKKYNEKSIRELKGIAENTDPYLETEKINDPIDLDGYAWYYSKINSDDFWKAAEMKDEENIKNGIYGKHIIKNKEELNSYLMG